MLLVNHTCKAVTCRASHEQPGIAAVACSTRQTQWMQWQVGQQQQHRQCYQQLRRQGQAVGLSLLVTPFVEALCASKARKTLVAAAAAMDSGRQQAANRQKRQQQRQQQQQQQSGNQPIQPGGSVWYQPATPVSASCSSVSYPRLLPYPERAAVGSYEQQLCDTLHISPHEAQLLLLNSQNIITLDRQQLTANWQQIQRLLPLPRPQLLQALLQLPDLLLQPKQVVAARLSEAAAVMQLPLTQLRGSRAKLTPQLHYQLLLLPKQDLEGKLQQLAEALGLGQPPPRHNQQQRQQSQMARSALKQQRKLLRKQRQLVVNLVRGEPALLSVWQAELVSTVEALEQVCAWPLGRLLHSVAAKPQLLVTPAQQLYAAAANMQQLFRLSEQGLALTLRRAPAALLVPVGQLADLLHELAEGLGAPGEVAADILLQEPDLLLRRPGAVSAVLGVLRSAFKLGNEELLQVVEFDPTVLSCSPGGLANSTKQLKQAAMLHNKWAAEYRLLMSKPVNVARALRVEPLRVMRLVYLHSMRRAAGISLRAAVSMTGRQFVLLYPGYKAWLAHNYSAGGVPRLYRGDKEGGEEEEEEEEDEEEGEDEREEQ